MLICGVARSRARRRCRRSAGRCSCAVAGVICIRPCAPAVRRLVAEVRLGVDHGGDERRVEVLVARLLADDVLVAQRQRDLAGRRGRRGRRDATSAHADDRERNDERRDEPRRRRARGPARGPRRAVMVARSLTPQLSRTPDNSPPTRPPCHRCATTKVARRAFSSCGELARGALVDGRVAACGRPLGRSPRRPRWRSSRRRCPPCPASKAAGSRRPRPRGGGLARSTSARDAATRGHPWPSIASSHARSSGRRTPAATAARSTTPPARPPRPSARRRRRETRPRVEPWTTASVERGRALALQRGERRRLAGPQSGRSGRRRGPLNLAD